MEKKSLKRKDGYQVYINVDLTPLRAKLLALVKRLDCRGEASTAPRRSRRVLPLERTRGLSSSSTLLTTCSSWVWNRLTSGPLV